MKVEIENSGEGNSKIIKNITKDEFLFLRKLFYKLNNHKGREEYSPILYIESLDVKKGVSE